MKTFNQIRYGEYEESEAAVTLRNSGGDCGGGNEVLVIETYKGNRNDIPENNRHVKPRRTRWQL